MPACSVRDGLKPDFLMARHCTRRADPTASYNLVHLHVIRPWDSTNELVHFSPQRTQPTLRPTSSSFWNRRLSSSTTFLTSCAPHLPRLTTRSRHFPELVLVTPLKTRSMTNRTRFMRPSAVSPE